MLPTAPTVWLLGQVTSGEFSPAIQWLEGQACCTTLADAAPAAGEDPAAILFCLARPGEISHAHLEALHRVCPLAKLMSLVGPWCEGELRSGRPWPGVTRIYWHQWQPRLIDEINGLNAQDRRLPRTLSEADRLLVGPSQRKFSGSTALVGVVTPRQTDFESLALVLAAKGHHAVRVEPHEPLPVLNVDALIVDGGSDVATAAAMLATVRSRLSDTPALLLGNFLRPEEVPAALRLPRTAILSKPFLMTDLLTRLSDLLGGSSIATHAAA